MNEEEHFKRLNDYFTKSKFGYDFFLYGAKHFSFYPENKKISEKEAQNLMHDLIGSKLSLNKSMIVLDAGCGQGVVSTYLAKKFGCRIEGISMVDFEIGKANELAKNIGVSDKANYYLMDYSNMKFKNSYFDRIYTIETLCHSADIKKTMREFFRVLKRGGKVAFFEYNLADDNKFTDYELDIFDKVIYSTAADSLKEFKPDRFENIIKETGFRKLEVEDITYNIKPSLNRLRRFASIPYLFVKLFNLQKSFPNLTIAVEFYKFVERNLFEYKIFSAEK